MCSTERRPIVKVTGTLGDVAASAGVGALAGLAGTAAMTISSTVEAKLRGRGSSDAPVTAAGTVLGVEPKNEQTKGRFGTLVHWGYGSGWGTVRGLLDTAGLHGAPAAAAHLGAVWAGEQVVLPATGASSPAWKWGVKEIGIDLFHHAVYAGATSAVAAIWRVRRATTPATPTGSGSTAGTRWSR
jgi:hypothetical protein